MSESTIIPSPSTTEGIRNGQDPILEERLAFMAKHMEDQQKLNPAADLKVGSQWWVPSVTLRVDLQVSSNELTVFESE
jgi:hypothetical protein